MDTSKRKIYRIKENTANLSIAALTAISQAITSELYLDDILKLIVTVTAEVLGSKICSLMLLNNRQELIILASKSISERYLNKPPLKIGEGIAGKVVLEKKPIAVYNIYRNPDFKYKEIARQEGLKSLLCTPLIVKNLVIGAIDVFTDYPHHFSEREKNVLTAVANQAAIVIENTELLVRTRVIQEELETRKLVERAKGLLMREQNIDEDSAYRLIQRQAMEKRKTMREIAEAILLVASLKTNNTDTLKS